MRKQNVVSAKIKPERRPCKRFSVEDDNVIIEQIKLYPTNLKHSFQESAKILDRDWTGIHFRYYKTLRKDPKVKAITCGSKSGFTQNVKNLWRDEDGNMPEQNLKGYMWVMKEMLELDTSERDLIINFFGGPSTINVHRGRKRNK